MLFFSKFNRITYKKCFWFHEKWSCLYNIILLLIVYIWNCELWEKKKNCADLFDFGVHRRKWSIHPYARHAYLNPSPPVLVINPFLVVFIFLFISFRISARENNISSKYILGVDGYFKIQVFYLCFFLSSDKSNVTNNIRLLHTIFFFCQY